MTQSSVRGAQGAAKRFRQITSPLRMLPDFVIPGEAKCGTTSFYRYLCKEPSIITADMKEPNNFWRHGSSPLFCRQHYPLRIFSFARKILGKRTLSGDASPEYFSKREVPQSIRELCPKVFLVFLFRDPVERAWSDYNMLVKAGVESRSFSERVNESVQWYRDPGMAEILDRLQDLEHHPARYVGRGRYISNLEPWLKEFPREQMMFVCSEAFFEDPGKQIDRALDLFGLPITCQKEWPVFKKGQGKTSMDLGTREKLEEFYAPFNRRLFDFLGEDWGWKI